MKYTIKGFLKVKRNIKHWDDDSNECFSPHLYSSLHFVSSIFSACLCKSNRFSYPLQNNSFTSFYHPRQNGNSQNNEQYINNDALCYTYQTKWPEG